MKPLFVSSLYHPHQVGGAEKVVRILAEGLLAQGHQPVVVTAHEDSADRVDWVNGVKVHYLGLKNVYWPWSRQERSAAARAVWHGIDRHNALMARAVARVIDAEAPELVHTHNLTGFSCAVWGVAKARRLPLIHTLHDYSLMCPKTSMFKDGRNCETQCASCKLYTSPARRLSGKVDQVVGVSRFTLQRHVAAGYFHGVPSRVIHNAIPAAVHPHPPRDPGGPLRLGYVGQLHPSKGIEELIQQMGNWNASQCQLLVAGRGAAAYESALRAQAPANVRFLGFVDPDEAYRAIDVLVVPSLWEEPLGMTVLEAAMHGVPAIVARRGGLPETVEHGRTGLVYEPKQPQGLRNAIDMLLRSGLDDMSARVRGRAEHFQLDRMREEYLRVIADARARQAGDPSRLQRSCA